ncbi:MAG: hypothetical protein CMH49_02340 [Myxococcales bacterium]|nr:hypothetical protein [Myxococcales bacterium]
MAPTRTRSKFQTLDLSSSCLMSLVIALFFLCFMSNSYAQKLQEVRGLWVPADGDLGRRSLSHVSIGGDRTLYAIGSGMVWQKKKSDTSGESRSTRWESIGRYAPLLTWDEAIGVNASGPFSSQLLSQVERQVGESIEAALDGQGDEDWITEDAALTLIESFEDEVSPAVDSPYRVNGVFPQQKGVWLATGSGLWATNEQGLSPLQNSPSPLMSVIQLNQELWVSTGDEILHTQDYLSYLSEESDEPLKWVTSSNQSTMSLINYQQHGFALFGHRLLSLEETKTSEVNEVILPVDTYGLESNAKLVKSIESDSLWAINQDGLWYSKSKLSEPVLWERCISIPNPMTHIKVNQLKVLVISPQEILSVSKDCQTLERYETPLGEGVMFTDATWWKQKLYASTSGGLFIWEAEGQSKLPKIALQYLKRDLEIFPKFFELYRAALKEQGLDPESNGYAARPVLSALLPQLTMRYNTRPSRVDTVPTFSIGSRQLSLLQPRPEYSVFFEWRISLDFLSALVDPERGSAYFETQNQVDRLVGDPLASSELESEVGMLDDWTNDMFTSQVQRLAMTTLALERRQKHRDRAQLRSQLARLHRERIKLTYRRWLQLDLHNEQRLNESKLKLQEIDAHLDAMSGYRLQIQDKMMPSL